MPLHAGDHLAMSTPTCPFCQLSPASSADRAPVAESALAYAIRDGYPVSPGHTLIIPHRHIPTWFDATRDEHLAILDLIDQVRADLLATPNPPDACHGWASSCSRGSS